MIKGMRMPDSRVRMIFLDAITDKDEDLIDMETFVDIVQQHGLKFKLQDTLEAQLMDNTVCGAKPCLAALACMGRCSHSPVCSILQPATPEPTPRKAQGSPRVTLLQSASKEAAGGKDSRSATSSDDSESDSSAPTSSTTASRKRSKEPSAASRSERAATNRNLAMQAASLFQDDTFDNVAVSASWLHGVGVRRWVWQQHTRARFLPRKIVCGLTTITRSASPHRSLRSWWTFGHP